MRELPLLLLALLLAGCLGSASERLNSEGSRVVDDWRTLDYRVWLPDGYDKDTTRSYPLLVWFHGGGETEWGWGRQGKIGELVAQRTEKGELQPFIVVSPSAGLFKPVMKAYERMLLEQLLPEVRRKYRVNGVTVAFGHSMGGLAALMVTMRHPEQFDAVAAASPFLFDTSPWHSEAEIASFDAKYGHRFTSRWRQNVADAFRKESEYRAHDPFSIARNGFRGGLKILLTSSEDDGLGLFPHNRMLHETFAQAGVEHEWIVQNGVGHGTVEDPRNMDWLNRQAHGG